MLRNAADAFAIRSFVQEQQARRAVVAGGGLLGLEAAYALHKLGVKVSVLGPVRARLDYRVFKLRGDALYSTVHRVYAGLNLAF